MENFLGKLKSLAKGALNLAKKGRHEENRLDHSPEYHQRGDHVGRDPSGYWPPSEPAVAGGGRSPSPLLPCGAC
jgi:hypothetical protein